MLIADQPLEGLNTFGVRARARYYTRIERPEDLLRVLETPRLAGLPRLWLGAGSNILFTRDFPGVVIRVALRGRARTGEDAESVRVTAAAGEEWHALVRWTLAQGWGGLENLVLIPGTVGAAPIQNIGAYGLELAERLEAVEAWDSHTGNAMEFSPPACQFGYRDSLFKHEPRGRYVITGVRLRLPRAPDLRLDYGEVRAQLAACGVDDPAPRDVADAIERIRRRRLPDPAALGNAGSFFKNPVLDSGQADALADAHPGLVRYPAGPGRTKLAAGWLLERAGWRGYRRGACGFYAGQALVLVNHGGATGAQLWALAQAAQASVMERFGVWLEPEPYVI